MDARLNRYYKKKISGGKSLVARAVDFIMLRSLMLFLIFIVTLYLSRSFTAAILISVFMSLAISLVLTVLRRKKAEKYLKKDMERIKQKCLLETLTLMNASAFSGYANGLFDGGLENIVYVNDGFFAQYGESRLYVLHNHPSSVCGVSEVLGAYRTLKDAQHIKIVCLSEFSDEAVALSGSLPAKVELISGQKILALAGARGMLPDESTAEQKAENEMSETIVTFEKLKKAALSGTKIKAYIFCGTAILCWPLITGFRIYYPILAAVCYAMAAITYRNNRQNKENSGVGIS